LETLFYIIDVYTTILLIKRKGRPHILKTKLDKANTGEIIVTH